MSQPRGPTSIWKWVWIAAIVVGALVTVWRGPGRAIGPGANQDFCLVYGQARAWVLGYNPYREEEVRRAFASAGAPADRDVMGGRRSSVLVYPPMAYPLWAPLAVLPWPVASWVWIALNTGMYLAAAWMIARLAGLSGTGLLGFAAAVAWSAPAQTAISHGQTSNPALVLIAAAALVQARRLARADDAEGGVGRGHYRGSWLCGALLGAAAVFKPHLGLLFLVYQIGRGRWRTTAWGAATAAALMLIGLGRMWGAELDGWALWVGNVRDFVTMDDANPTRANGVAHHALNLHFALHRFTDERALVSAAVLAILGAISLGYFVGDVRRGWSGGERRQGWQGEILSLAMTAVVTLSIVYHRHYDGVVILFLAAAVAVMCRRPGVVWAKVVLGLVVASFAAPYAVVMVESARSGLIPASIAGTWVFDRLVVPAQAWALPIAAIVLAWLRWTWGPSVQHGARPGDR